MLDIKNTVTEMKTDFYGLISRQDMVIKRISELKYIPIEYLRTRKEREQRWKKKKPQTEQNIQGQEENYERYNIHVIGIP